MKKILIVDDDYDFVNALKILLQSQKYKVSEASNTKEAEIKIKEEKPDLIILDVMMDSPDEGFQFSYKLKRDESLKNIPIVMTTSVSKVTGFKFSPETDNIESNWIPVDKFIEKPIQSEAFLKTVKEFLKE